MKKNQGKTGLSRAFSFAHLIGRAEQDGQDGQDDDSKQRPDESDEDYAKRMEEEERKQRDDETDEEYQKRMDELDNKDAGDDGTDAEDDTEGEGETDKEKAARGRERARCAAIFASQGAATRPDVAAHLAFQTDMSAKAAVGMLTAFAVGGAPARNTLASRMTTVKQTNTGTGAAAAPVGANAVANRILAAGKMRRGEK